MITSNRSQNVFDDVDDVHASIVDDRSQKLQNVPSAPPCMYHATKKKDAEGRHEEAVFDDE